MRLDRPIGILLLLWPTLWALWLAAEGMPRLDVLAIFIGGVVLMRSAGCVINDYADRWLDPQVERTRERPLAAGRVGGREALALFVLLLMAAFGLVLLTNTLTILLSLGGALLAVLYPYTKRHTHFPQVVLGAAFGWAIPMAFAAQSGSVPALAWLLFSANVLWSTAYDTEYAMVDREDDIKAGSRSTAILFGDLDRPIVALLQIMFLLSMAMVGSRAGLGLYYAAGLGVAALLVAWQIHLIRGRERAACFSAFLNNHWIGLVIFAGLALDYALRVKPA
jgi:4-hydroxybenzoate polyprenyltransferase